MKITFICAVFPPEPEPAGVMAHQLATRLARNGHTVTMIVPIPNRPHGTIYSGYKVRLRSRTVTKEGYTLVHCANWLIGKRRRHVSRILENITFGLSSAWATWKEGRPDVIILETWPFVATELILRLSRHWQTPVINYIQDCYPEALEHTGHIKTNGRIAQYLRRWESEICRRCTQIIAISEGMKQLLCSTRHIPDNKVSVIGNWLDARLFPVLPRDNGWRREVGISDEEFLVLFAGTLGYVSGADVLVEVGRILEHHAAALLVCVGEGVLREKMEHSAAAAGLRNLRFLPFQPSERVAQMHAAADATVLPTQAGHSDASVPSKLITYLAAGRPVVCAADEGSTVAQIVREANTGVLAEPGNAESIASALLFLVDHATERKQMGENARRYFEKHYTLERAYPQFAVLLKETRTCNAQ